MPLAPDKFQPSQPTFGYSEQPNIFWKALEGVVNSLRGMHTSKANLSLFHEPTVTAGAGVEQGLNAAGDVMADPRNAWMGFGPLAMSKWARAGKGLGGWNNFLIKELQRAPDMGGFNVPTSKMLRDDMMMLRGTDLPEAVKRDDYIFGRRLENKTAAAIQNPFSAYHDEALQTLQNSSPIGYAHLKDIMKGQAELQGEMAKRRNPLLGGSIPPYWFTPKE